MLKGFSSKKFFLILIDKEEDVINYVIKDFYRGIIFLFVEGEYIYDCKKMLYCIVIIR